MSLFVTVNMSTLIFFFFFFQPVILNEELEMHLLYFVHYQYMY